MLVSPFSPDSFNDVIVLGNFAIFACFDLDNKILVTSIYFMFNPSLFEFMNPPNCQQITSMLQKRDKTVTSLNNEFNGGLNYLHSQI